MIQKDRGVGSKWGEGGLTCLLFVLPLIPLHACVVAAAALRPAVASSVPPAPWPDDPTDKSMLTCL